MSVSKNFNFLTEEKLAQWIEQGYIEIDGQRVPFDATDLQATEFDLKWGEIGGDIDDQADLVGRFQDLNNKINGRMSLASADTIYEWNGDPTGRATIVIDSPKMSCTLVKVSDTVHESAKFISDTLVTIVRTNTSGETETETRPGSEFMSSGGEGPGYCYREGFGRIGFFSGLAGIYTLDTMDTVTVPEDGTYLMSCEDAGFYIYVSKIAESGGGTSTHYVEQNGDDITEALADTLRPELDIPEVEANPTGTPTAKLVKFKLNGITYALAGAGALVYNNIQAFVTDFNSKVKSDVEVGTIALIRTKEVPDLWISANNESTSVPYTYTTDAQFVADLKAATETGLKVGYYRVNELEADKVFVPVQDVQMNGVSILNNGVANIPIASNNDLGVVKAWSALGGINVTGSGQMYIVGATNADLDAKSSSSKPVVCSNLVYATKVGMTGNTALTDTEKSTVRSNIGAVTQILVSDNL